jgi:hypothetical protein
MAGLVFSYWSTKKAGQGSPYHRKNGAANRARSQAIQLYFALIQLQLSEILP